MHSIFQIGLPEFINSKYMRLAVTSLVLALASGYFFEISRLTTSGYEIAKLEKMVATLQDKEKQLNTELAAEQSIVKIQKRLENSSMKTAANIKYVRYTETAVAQR